VNLLQITQVQLANQTNWMIMENQTDGTLQIHAENTGYAKVHKYTFTHIVT